MYLGAEQERGHLCDLLLLLPVRSRTGECCGGADALEVWRIEEIPDASDEHGDIRSLAPPVGMKLVEDEELESACRLHQRPIVGPGRDEIEHDVVGQQDIGRVRLDLVAFLVRLLAGVAGKGDWASAVGVAVFEELLQLAHLAVGERVHGVDDDRLDAIA